MNPREFFIEDRLEKFRLTVSCNLGESGLRNFTVGEIFDKINLPIDIMRGISLADSPNRGREDLRTEIASLYNNVSPDQVLITSGTSEALYIIFHLIIEKGDVVSYFSPAFQAIYEIPFMLGAELNPVLVKDSLDVKELFQDNVKLAILNHPHNPTGIGLQKEDIDLLKEIILNYKGYTIFDEHYRFLDYNSELGFSGALLNEKCIATGSITKCFGVTGLRIGWIVADKKLIEKARSFKDYLTHTVNPISEFIAYEIIKKRKEILTPIKYSIQQNIEIFYKAAHDLPFIQSFRKPDGGLVSIAKLKEGVLSEYYSDELLKQCDIFVLPANNFEQEGWIRIGFGETPERFKAGIERWKYLKI